MSERDTQIALASSKRSTLARRAAEVLAKRGLDDLLVSVDGDEHRCLAAVSTTNDGGSSTSGAILLSNRSILGRHHTPINGPSFSRSD